jgi:hypothetical protein
MRRMITKPTKHISTSRLFDTSDGLRTLSSIQRKHLHQCDYCQLILKAFVTGIVENASQPDAKRRTSAA